jgi:PAS domain-containing protein
VLLALEPGRRRDLLVEWLRVDPEYEVTVAGGEDEPPFGFDLCVVDLGAFGTHAETLAERRAAVNPVVLPVLLLHAEADPSLAALNRLEGERGESIDTVVEMPAEKSRLKREIDSLLRTRELSLHLHASREQYQQLVEVLPEGIVLLDSGSVRWSNTAADELLTPGETVGGGGGARPVPRGRGSADRRRRADSGGWEQRADRDPASVDRRPGLDLRRRRGTRAVRWSQARSAGHSRHHRATGARGAARSSTGARWTRPTRGS